MNKYFLLLFFCINLPGSLLTSDSSDDYKHGKVTRNAKKCRVTNEPSKIIYVLTSQGFTDQCFIYISNSSKADNFGIYIQLYKGMNTCATGIEYINPRNPTLKKFKDGQSIVCAFKIYPELIEIFDISRSQEEKYLGKYWQIIHEYRTYYFGWETNVFFMNTADWWKQSGHTHLALRAPSKYWINDYSYLVYYSV